jgi:hypothetical protein
MASSNPGDVVFDPFVGSGTTAAVAKRLGRKYVGIDLSEQYAEFIRARVAKVDNESNARPAGNGWPELHVEFLTLLYREANVVAANLLANQVALQVIAASLSVRAGCAYTVEQVTTKLDELWQSNGLPKLPNDVPFARRDHVTERGKRYVRTVQRWKGRRSDDAQPALNFKQAF